MSQKLYFFDLDRTLIKVNVSFAFGKYLYEKGEFPFAKMFNCVFLYACHKYLYLSIHQLQEKIFKIYFHEQSISKIQCNVESFLAENLSSLIYSPAYFALQSARNAGHEVTILSSSPDFLVEPIAKRLAVNWKASCYLKNDFGKLSELKSVLDGNAKAKIVQEMAEAKQIAMDDIFAYSDSYLDLPFLETAGCPIAVNPDKKLLKISHKNNWKVI